MRATQLFTGIHSSCCDLVENTNRKSDYMEPLHKVEDNMHSGVFRSPIDQDLHRLNAATYILHGTHMHARQPNRASSKVRNISRGLYTIRHAQHMPTESYHISRSLHAPSSQSP